MVKDESHIILRFNCEPAKLGEFLVFLKIHLHEKGKGRRLVPSLGSTKMMLVYCTQA